jgi:hypothetical protein
LRLLRNSASAGRRRGWLAARGRSRDCHRGLGYCLVPFLDGDNPITCIAAHPHQIRLASLYRQGSAITSVRRAFSLGACHVLNDGRVHVLPRLRRALGLWRSRTSRNDRSDSCGRSRRDRSWIDARSHHAVPRLVPLIFSIQSTSRPYVGSRTAPSDMPSLLGSHHALVDGATPLSEPRD